MGCDIHLYVERRQDGRWVAADKWVKGKYADDEGEPKLEVPYEERFYTGRSYNLFSILANVRNGSGFAGVKTGEGFNPIFEPRGIPDDCSPEYRAEAEYWNGDGHSHSHCTVAELLAYDWTQVTRQCGYVNPAEWARWRKDGKPDGWCGMIGGGSVKILSNEEMEAAFKRSGVDIWDLAYPGRGRQREAVAAVSAQTGGSPYTLVSWEEPYYRAVNSSFLAETMPRLWRLGPPEDVRIVFFFDN